MRKSLILFVILSFTTIIVYAQDIPKKPTLSDVRSFNRSNLIKIEIGMSKSEVIKSMGGIKAFQTYISSGFLSRKRGHIINNPFNRDIKIDKNGKSIEILWYYTDRKKADNAINKDELTPIILEKNKVVGMGWSFYSGYAKKNNN